MIENYAHWVIRWRYLVVLISTLLILTAASGMPKLGFTTDYRIFFSQENPQLNAFESLQDTYTKNDNILIALEPKDGNVFTRETLAAVEWLTEQAWQIPYSIRVDSISNFQHTFAEVDDLIVEDLITEAENFSATQLADVKQIALNEPLLVNRLVSPQGHVTGINVIVQLPGKKPAEEVPQAVKFVRDVVAEAEQKFTHLNFHLTGMIIMNNAFPEASIRDMSTLVPGMYLMILVMLALLFRGMFGTLGTLLIIAFSIMGAMGITGWLGIPLSPPSATAPTIILTLAVADSVHILTSLLHEMRVNKLKQNEAIVESLRINFQPVFLTSLTTAIGFLSMNFSEAPPFQHLGNIVAMGVGLAFLLSITLLPAFMAIVPLRVKHVESDASDTMGHLADFVIKQKQRLMWGMALIILVLIAFVPRNELNDIYVEYFDETIDFRTATDFVTANLTGLYDIHYSLGAGEAEGISDPEFLQKVEDFAQWYRQQPETIHVNTITDVFKRLNKNMHADDPAYYRLPEDKQLAAQYLLLYEMSLPYGLDLNNQINVDKSATRVAVALKTLSTNQLLDLEERAQAWLQENGLPAMQVHGASTSIMFAHIGYRNIRSMLIGVSLALVLISFILIFALRSLKYGLISLVPNLVPALMGFGLWGILVGEVGLALSVVASMTLGIVVDDTIHFLSKYLRALREQNLSPEDAVRYAFRSVGMALWITSVVLIAGFSILAFSSFQLNAGMGLLTAITIALALVADFLFLPPLLMQLEEKSEPSSSAAETASA